MPNARTLMLKREPLRALTSDELVRVDGGAGALTHATCETCLSAVPSVERCPTQPLAMCSYECQPQTS